jgi:hypothetical protein
MKCNSKSPGVGSGTEVLDPGASLPHLAQSSPVFLPPCGFIFSLGSCVLHCPKKKMVKRKWGQTTFYRRVLKIQA